MRFGHRCNGGKPLLLADIGSREIGDCVSDNEDRKAQLNSVQEGRDDGAESSKADEENWSIEQAFELAAKAGRIKCREGLLSKVRLDRTWRKAIDRGGIHAHEDVGFQEGMHNPPPC